MRYQSGLHPVLPTTSSALVTYIARERAFRGIGANRAQPLADELGDELKSALLAIDDRVIKIVGEAAAIAASVAMELREAETDFLSWLHSVGADIPDVKAIRLARAWGPQGVSHAKKNPYLLLAVTDFKTVDAIASAIGVGSLDMRRDVAALEAALVGDKCLGQGSTRMAVEDALSAAERLLGRPLLPGAVDAAVASGGAVRAGDFLQPPGTSHMEAECAIEIARLSRAEPIGGATDDQEISRLLALYEGTQAFPLTGPQRAAVCMAHKRRLAVLAGYAGSGKTTVLRGICDTIEVVGRKPLVVTLSGRAAKRAAEATGRPAMTVARFLLDVEKAKQPLQADVALIADEASMLGLVEIWRIIRRLGDATLLLCGDPAQLPPVSPGVVFHQLAVDDGVQRVVLDRVHRQDETTGIPALGEGVRNGTIPTLSPFKGSEPGVTFTACKRDDIAQETLHIGNALRLAGINRNEIQIVAPTNAEISSINAYFHKLRMSKKPAAWPITRHVAEGEPIIWTGKNDIARGLMNGSLGRIVSIRPEGLVAELDGAVHMLKPEDGDHLQLAYAISVHKSQGSQWQKVVVPVFKSRVVDRSLIYTALTRAQDQVIFMGDFTALSDAVRREPAVERRSCGFPGWLSLARFRAKV